MTRVIAWMERHQVLLFLTAILAGAGIGLLVPQLSGTFEAAINPVLGLLLYVTFLGVPFARVGAAFRDWRFLVTVMTLNFVIVPVVVFALSRFVAFDQALLVGVLFVLLTPCVDYVIVFTGLAGGAQDRLLAATPLLMLAQIALLPVYLWVMVGPQFVQTIDVRPFIDAFVFLILIPLAAAVLTQLLARTRLGKAASRIALAAMVPLMMATLAIVVASQIFHVSQQISLLLAVIPIFVLYAAVMVPIGLVSGSIARLDVPGRRAVVFSGATRNSLVVLPLVLALPAAFALAPLVVVTQTLVELVAMVVLVKLIPRLIRPLAESISPHRVGNG